MGRRSRETRERRESRAAAAARQAPSAPSSGAGRFRFSIWKWLLVPALGAVVAGAFFVLRPTAEPLPRREVPEPDLTWVPAPVAAALSDARKRLLSDIDSADAWGEYGRWLDAHHLYEHAEPAYRAAYELAPDNFQWAYLLAVIKDFRGADIDEIVGSFETAMRLNDVYPPAPYRYGEALMRQGRLDEARDAFRKAVGLDPDFAMAHRGLGHALIALNDADGAVRHLERAAQLEPQDGMVYSGLARAYQMQGKRDQALEAADRASTLSPIYGVPDPIRYYTENLAITGQVGKRRYRDYMRQGDYAKAIADLEQLVEIFAEDEVYRADLARCYGQNGVRLAMGNDLAGAIAQFELAAARDPDAPEIHHNWGTALMRVGNLDDAAMCFERALELNFDHAPTHYNLGMVLENLGHQSLAIDHYKLAVELGPSPHAVQRLSELNVE